MSKGSQRRLALISRGENDLRWDLALGVITMDVFTIKMKGIKTKTLGTCGRCIDGLLVGVEYSVTCRLDSSKHHSHDSCEKFREDK